MKARYDSFVVGAGSSGCVVANRLSANPDAHVLLVEAGPNDSSWLIRMPRGLVRLVGRPGDPHSWFYQASKGVGRPSEQWQKGRTLSGSSSINGMVYVRGHPRDYDRWEEAGCVGWLTEAIIAAAEAVGTARVTDTNEAPHGGVGYASETIWDGERQSAAVAFMRPASRRPNLDVVTGTQAVRILFEGKRAVGIVLRDRDGEHTVAAHREIVLSAGAIETPKHRAARHQGHACHPSRAGYASYTDGSPSNPMTFTFS